MRTITDLNLKGVAAFVAVAEQQSFRGAARSLNLSKSTLSQQVARLEAQLGAELLRRTTRNVRLTAIGERYYRAVAPALATLSTAEQLVQDHQGRPRGRLRMTAPVEWGQCTLGAVLAEYGRRHPEVEVTAELSDRVMDLAAEGFDLAVRIGPLRDSSLIRRRLATAGTKRLYASPEYLAGAGRPRIPRDLARHSCLVMGGAEDAASWQFAGPKGSVSVAVRPRMSAASWSIVGELATAGLGIARLPELTAAQAVAAGTLEEVLERWAPPAPDCYAVYPPARTIAPSVRAMVDLLAEHMASRAYGCARHNPGG